MLAEYCMVFQSISGTHYGCDLQVVSYTHLEGEEIAVPPIRLIPLIVVPSDINDEDLRFTVKTVMTGYARQVHPHYAVC